jgi:DNA helicase-2/ATP-dependent DNA helicase PcrA
MTARGFTGSLFDPPPATGPDLAALARGLNPAQAEAVAHDDGPMLVLAGAGSGKTRVLTTRIARLIAARGVAPHEILAVTFTNKAAGEMRERIGRLLGEEPRGMWCGTFHALGARLLRGVATVVGRQPNFTIYDEDDTLGLVKRIMERRRLSPTQWAPKAILGAISSAKNALVSPGDFTRAARDPFAVAVAGVYADLEGALEQANAVTFDDLLVLPVRVLERDEGVRAHYQRRFRYLLVDEYQDTNSAQ